MGVVRSLRASPAAREGWSCFRAIFRCFPDDRMEASELRRRFGTLWVQTDGRRSGGMFAASQAGWDPPGGCWRSGERFWMVGLPFWRLWKEFAGWVGFWSGGGVSVCCGDFGL